MAKLTDIVWDIDINNRIITIDKKDNGVTSLDLYYYLRDKWEKDLKREERKEKLKKLNELTNR